MEAKTLEQRIEDRLREARSERSCLPAGRIQMARAVPLSIYLLVLLCIAFVVKFRSGGDFRKPRCGSQMIEKLCGLLHNVVRWGN